MVMSETHSLTFGKAMESSANKKPEEKFQRYEQNWRRELFTVYEIVQRTPIVYILKDLQGEEIKGTYYIYEAELQKGFETGFYPVENVIKQRKRRRITEYFVKFLGYPEKFNDWVIDIQKGIDFQKGYGIGGIFRRLFRAALPFLVRGGKTIGKEVLMTGSRVASDVLSGENFREAVKTRSRESGKKLAQNAIDRVQSMVGKGQYKRKRVAVVECCRREMTSVGGEEPKKRAPNEEVKRVEETRSEEIYKQSSKKPYATLRIRLCSQYVESEEQRLRGLISECSSGPQAFTSVVRDEEQGG
ncbi:chromo domain-containing protein [Trichonephila clavipes]|nr:chromo domain-containing protein [Trichonephila clavipes]